MTKNIKKLFALLLSALLLAGVLPLSAFADTPSDVTTVGLEEVKVSANYAYLRIQVLEDSVAVFSNPINSKYYISSDTLLSALKSNNGYTLSYVLEEGGDAAGAAHVVGGYIKASKAEADDIYIPVVCKADYVDTIRLDQAGSMWTEAGADNVASTSVAAVGGKPSDDYSRKVEVTTDGLSGYYLMKLEGNKDTNVKEWIDDYHGSTVKDWIDNFDTT
ncbi:MAG: hypothetical protein IKV73_04325, partial [Clostridia bacterium]|nr:hypothetical protein [Clostridia bacterium]